MLGTLLYSDARAYRGTLLQVDHYSDPYDTIYLAVNVS